MTAGPSVRRNPFPGLRPFQADEEQLFFGRELQVDDLLGRLRRSRFVAVVGTSGSGKSSLVRAGLLPALHGGFMAGAGSRWRIATMRPGNRPINSLARAVVDAGLFGQASSDQAMQIGFAQAVLERGALGLVEIVQQARLGPDENVLVLVDQFEELFRFALQADNVGNEAAAFVKLLLAAISQSDLPIYVVITMRSDFLGDCAEFRDLPETINDGLFLIPRMTRAQLQQAIEGPVGVAGGRIAPRLVTRLLNDVGDDPDQLPVLQHGLMRTWDLWEADHAPEEPLDVRHYEATGGLDQALSRHGDEIYASLPSDRARAIAEALFKCLTELGGDNRGIRRPTRFDTACAITGASPEELRQVAEAFRAPSASFIMPPAGTPLESATVLDIAHESLMRTWTRLQTWVREEAQSAQIYRRLADAAELHAQNQAALWRDPDLGIAVAWREENRPTAAWAERYAPGFDIAMRFLDESHSEATRSRRQRVIRVRTAIATLSAAVVLLLGLSVMAVAQWRLAAREYSFSEAAMEVLATVAAADRAPGETREERKLDDEGYEGQRFDLIPNSAEAKLLGRVTAKLEPLASKIYGAPFTFYVTRTTEPDSYVFYGPRVYVSRGMVRYFDNLEELAFWTCGEIEQVINHRGSESRHITSLATKELEAIMAGNRLADTEVFVPLGNKRYQYDQSPILEKYGVFVGDKRWAVRYDLEQIDLRYTNAQGASDFLGAAQLCARAGFNPWGGVWAFRKIHQDPNLQGIFGTRVIDELTKYLSGRQFNRWSDRISSATPLR